MAMECRFCHKVFSKGEHLRRHERSHTGSRPYVCKECSRSFSRQDSLMRHEKLHNRKDCQRYVSPISDAISSGSGVPDSIENIWIRDQTENSLSTTSPHEKSLPDQEPAIFTGIQHVTPPAELDFELIWPDSEDLFHTIMSSESTNQWQIPMGTLPFPPEPYAASNLSFGSPRSFDDRAPSIGVIPSGGNHQAVHDVSNMISSLSSSVTAAVESTSITSVFLDECLHMFFVRFIPTFPILHRSTFVFRECAHPLLLNAIAIGSLYLAQKDAVAKGEVLWRLAHTAVSTSWQTLISHRGPYDACPGVQLVITALLVQVYGALSKSRAIRTTSQAFHALGFCWAGHCGMFDTAPYPMNELPPENASEAEKVRQWRVWSAREIQHRALLAHYMLDGLVSQISGKTSSGRHVTNQLSLPSSQAAFEADNAEEWLIHLRSQPVDPPSFRTIFRLLFCVSNDTRWLSYSLSAFSYRVIIEGLQSLISQCEDDENDTALGMPNKSETCRALARVYESIRQNVYMPNSDRLETLLRWHAVCLDAITSSSSLCKYVCDRCGIDQHIWANGKGLRSDFDVIQWTNSPDGRRALLHALAIQEIVETLPRGRAHAIHMPNSLFAAVTIYSVFSLAGLTTVKIPSTVEWKHAVYAPASEGTANKFLDAHTQHLSIPVPLDAAAAASASPNSTNTMTTGPAKSDTTRYILDGPTRLQDHHHISPLFLTTRNLLYEFNSMQKLFGCLSTQWGVASEMARVIDRWIALCH